MEYKVYQARKEKLGSKAQKANRGRQVLQVLQGQRVLGIPVVKMLGISNIGTGLSGRT
jgi:hypothetical protein